MWNSFMGIGFVDGVRSYKYPPFKLGTDGHNSEVPTLLVFHLSQQKIKHMYFVHTFTTAF